MDTADSRHLSRLSKLLLVSAGVAFAWVLLSLTLGLSASQAQADGGGLLGGATDIVDDGATAVTEVVSDTGAAAVETVAPVVQPVVNMIAQPVAEVVAPAAADVVQPVLDTVVEPVAEIVAPVVASTPVAPVVGLAGDVVSTVADLPAGGILTPIADTALGLVTSVPIVGGVVTGLGVDTAVTSVGSSVDGVLQGGTTAVVDTVTGIVSPVGGVLAPIGGVITGPAIPSLGGLGSAIAPTPPNAVADAAAHPLLTLARAAYLAGAATAMSLSSDLSAALTSADSTFVSTGAIGGIFALLRAVMQADSVLIGPGGAGPGAWVLVALGLVVAYRAWVRRSGLENDVAPPAPVLSTDVSPD